MRKLILTGMAVAMLAIPAAASASVNVNDGVGTVDKGDVQTALGWNNPAFDKGALDLNFTASAQKVTDYQMTCINGETFEVTHGGHRIHTQPGTATVTSTPIYNAGNRKQITGFNLTGQTGSFTNVGNYVRSTTGCPEGTFVYLQEPVAPTVTVMVTGDLKVNGIALPNTPVEVASAA